MWMDMFDLNGDGKVDLFEQTTSMMMLDDIFGRKNCTDINENELEKKLELAGLDRDELELMDEDEREEVLENAGFNMDDF